MFWCDCILDHIVLYILYTFLPSQLKRFMRSVLKIHLSVRYRPLPPSTHYTINSISTVRLVITERMVMNKPVHFHVHGAPIASLYVWLTKCQVQLWLELRIQHIRYEREISFGYCCGKGSHDKKATDIEIRGINSLLLGKDFSAHSRLFNESKLCLIRLLFEI